MKDSIVQATKNILLTQIEDDYTQIDYIGILESEIPDFKTNKLLGKQMFLDAVKELLNEKKIRVGVLNLEQGPPYLNYWQMSDDKIVNKLDKEWDNYFGPNRIEYHLIPTFDLTEQYAREIGKYISDQQKNILEFKNFVK